MRERDGQTHADTALIVTTVESCMGMGICGITALTAVIPQ